MNFLVRFVLRIILPICTASSVSAGFIAPDEVEAGVAACRNKSDWLGCASGIEKKRLGQAHDALSRNGKILKIKTQAKTVTLTDKKLDDYHSDTYRYLTFDAKIKSHVVFYAWIKGNFGGGYYKVIPDFTGREFDMLSYPVISPDGQYLLAYAGDLSGDSDNGVEVWQINGGQFKKVADFHEMDWAPVKAVWSGPNQILVKKECMTETNHCGNASISLSGGAWKLIDKSK